MTPMEKIVAKAKELAAARPKLPEPTYGYTIRLVLLDDESGMELRHHTMLQNEDRDRMITAFESMVESNDRAGLGINDWDPRP